MMGSADCFLFHHFTAFQTHVTLRLEHGGCFRRAKPKVKMAW